jgi:hypothetical protein
VGRGSRKAARFTEDKPKNPKQSMYKADRPAEPWPTIDQRLGAYCGVTTPYISRYRQRRDNVGFFGSLAPPGAS